MLPKARLLEGRSGGSVGAGVGQGRGQGPPPHSPRDPVLRALGAGAAKVLLPSAENGDREGGHFKHTYSLQLLECPDLDGNACERR